MKKTQPLRVLSYNIHKGFSTGNRQFVLRRIREAIRTVHPDLVFLQEVLGHHEEHRSRYADWPEQSQFEFLSHEIWPHYAYGKNAVYDSGHHGNAILSKYPLSFWENIDISTNRMERRGLLHAIVDVPGRHPPVHAFCLHLGLFETDRKVQTRRLCDRIDSHVSQTDPLVIAGDFNDWRGRVTGELEKRLEIRETFQFLNGAHARTYPSWLPALRLDRIYFRGMKPKNAKCLLGKPWNELSDHIALLAELTI